MPKTITKDLGILHQRAMFSPESINDNDRTVEVVVATEAPVRTYSWEDGRVNEILSMKSGSVRLGRINSGAPLLKDHRSSLDNTIGVIVDGTAKVVNNELRAVVRFAKAEDDEEADKVFRKVKDGILRNISVGYRVYKYQVTKRDGELPEYLAVDWEPVEVSVVPVPADADAGVRSDSGNEIKVEIINSHNKQVTMTKDQMRAEVVRLRALDSRTAEEETQLRDLESKIAEAERSVQPDAPTPAPSPSPEGKIVDENAVRSAATEAERNRITQIRAFAETAGFDNAQVDKFITDGTSLEAVRSAAFDKFLASGGQNVNGNVSVRADEADKFRQDVSAGILLRSASVPEKDLSKETKERGVSFRTRTFLQIAEECLRREGVDMRGMSNMEIMGRAITSNTGDFPVILADVNRQILLSNYNATADTWRRFCMVGSVSDFRDHKRLRMGSFSRLDKVGENSEYKNKSIPDAEFEKIAAETYGNIINVSRKMLINDDLGAFSRLPMMLGRAAARSIEIDVYALLVANPTLEDGIALFNASHGNIGTGSAISVAGLDADRLLMREQTDPSGNDYLDIMPDVLVVPVGLESTAKMLNTSQYDPTSGVGLQKPNVVLGIVSDVVGTPRLSGTTRYMFANPSVEPVIEVAFLDGNQAPMMDMAEEFNVDGMSWKIRHDYGVGAIGYRGVVRNAGV